MVRTELRQINAILCDIRLQCHSFRHNAPVKNLNRFPNFFVAGLFNQSQAEDPLKRPSLLKSICGFFFLPLNWHRLMNNGLALKKFLVIAVIFFYSCQLIASLALDRRSGSSCINDWRFSQTRGHFWV